MIVLPYFKMANFAGIIDSKTVLVIVYVAFGLPFAVWILRGFLLDLPREVEEAARLDGLSWLQIIFRLILPMVAPGIAVTTIFTFVFSWNEFLFAVFLTYDKAQTMPVALQKTIGRVQRAVGFAERRRGHPVASDGARRVSAAAAHCPWARARRGEIGGPYHDRLHQGTRQELP